MAVSTVVKTKRDGLISIADGGGFGGGNDLDISLEVGDFSATVPGEIRIDILDRGVLGSNVRYGDDQIATGSFTVYLRDLTDATAACLMDILNQSGHVGSTWVSTLGASAEVMAYDLKWTIEGTDHGDAADHTATFADVTFDYVMADGDPDTITVNWTCHSAVRPTLT